MILKKSEFFDDENKKFLSKLLIISVFLLLLWFIYKIWSILIILLFSLFLNMLFSPFLNKFNKYKINDFFGIIFIYFLILFFIFIVFFSIIPIFAKQTLILVDYVSNLVNDLIIIYKNDWVSWFWLPKFIEVFLNWLDINQVLNSIKENISSISAFVWKNLNSFLTNWAWFFVSITNFFINIVLVFIFTFFIALERKNIREFFYKILPENIRKNILLKEKEIIDNLYNWLKWQIILALSIFFITLFWLFFIRIFWVKIDEFFTLSLIAWMMEFVPYIWPFIALLPALAIALGISYKAVIIIFVLYLVIQQIENNVLVPYVMWKTLSLSPFSVLIAMTIWASLFWIIWIIIAIPVVSIIQIFVKDFLKNK